jgi:hypothetical protein
MNGGVVGVFIAPTTKLDRWWRLSVRWRTGQSGAHRTCPMPQPRHQFRWILTVGAPDLGARLDVRCTPDMYCSMSGAPVWACLPSARAARALNASQVAVGAEIVVAPRMHRTVRCTPDMSGAPATSPKPLGSDHWSSVFWARPDVRWRTGHVLLSVRCASMGVPDLCARWRAINASQVAVGA